MIVEVWRPKIVSKLGVKETIYFTKCDINEIYNKNSQRLKVLYKCDSHNCKYIDKIYCITREHLNEKRSKTVNDKLQICKSCQMSGENNPRFNDNRTWDEIMGIEKSKIRKFKLSINCIENNPSKNDISKIKKNQIIINFENVNNYLNKIGLYLKSINGNNKFATLIINCRYNHEFKLQWASMKNRKNICKYCYYESIRIPFEQIEEFELYSKTVRSLTRFSFNKNKKFVKNSELKIIDSKNYHIDHIYSISDGFINNIDPKIISSYINLRVIPKIDNLKKGKKSDISLNRLNKLYNSI